MDQWDVIVLGGGAAGLMCAREAAARGRKVLVLESCHRPAPKILVSGGGRCNFTNLRVGPADYVSTNPGFTHHALQGYSPKDFIALVKARSIPFHEKKDGQLFCDHSAKAILELLLERAKEKNVEILLNQDTKEVSHSEGVFTLKTPHRTFSAPRLVVATGGLSWPQLGATDMGYRLARQFGLKVIEPSPALVGLTFPEKEQARFEGLSGIHLRVGAACGKWSLVEDLMITHQGLSGPAILNASLHWNPGMELTVDWIPAETMEATLGRLRKDPTGSKQWLRETLPRRLADRLMHHAGAKGNWKDLPPEKLRALAETLHAYRFVPSGTFGYRMAEVTRGGVDTREVNRKTMECRKVPGLFFIGEVLDVTGKLGGFNFQWAWASAVAAGRNV